MAGIVSVAVSIAGAIAAAASAIISAVAAVTSAIAAAVAAIGSVITATVSAIVAGVTAIVGTIAATVGGLLANISAIISGPIAEWAGAFWKWGHWIYEGIKYVTEALHLKVLMRVHSIAYILSEDYRKMIMDLQMKIAELGAALSISSDGILNLLKNGETLVKTASAIMGKAYDVSDITWLKTLKNFLKERKDDIKNMGKTWRDFAMAVEEHIVKPALDTVSELQQVKWKFLLDLGDTADETINNIQEIVNWALDADEAINLIYEQLPDYLQDYVKPWVDEVSEEFHDFREDIYYPFKEKANDLINTIQGKQRQQKQKIDDIVDQLLRPGDVLKNVDNLRRDERIDQENKVGEIASRPLKRENEQTENQAEPSFSYLEKIRELLEKELPPPDWKIGIWKELVVPPGEQSKDANTWFVGDY